MILLEEELVLGADFINFMAQCLKVIDEDSTLAGISAFNENGRNCRTCAQNLNDA